MSVVQKKICMLGAFSVGKTSLVSQYVHSIFSEKYTTTIGVKINKKQLEIDEQTLSMILWDVYGEDNHQSVMPSYLRGLAGYILVADPTRPSTIETTLSLNKMVGETIGDMPFVLALNKVDIKELWDENALAQIHDLSELSVGTFETSAKTDKGVDDLFECLAQSLLTSHSSS